MRALRVVWRSVAIGLLTVVHWVVLLLALLVLLPFPAARRRFRRAVFKSWSRGILRVLNVRVEVRGDHPPEPALIISNHLSYLDITVLAAEIPACFVAKAEIRGWPVAGWICRSASTIFVDRDLRRDVVRVGALMRDALDVGDSVILFPEGTSTCGFEVAPFKSSLLAPAASAQLDVHTSAVSYRTPSHQPPAHNSVCWWGVAPFGPHFWEMLQLERIDAVIAFGETAHRHHDRKELTKRAHREISSRFVQVVAFEPEDPWADAES